MSAKQTRSASADISSRSRSRFSYLTDAGTTLATVFSYLNGELSKTLSQREGKQRAADALLAFWKPYALQAQKADTERVQKAAQSSVEALFRQIQTVCDDFDVKLPMMQTAVDLESLAFSLELREALIAIAKHIEKTAEPIRDTIPLTSPVTHSTPVNSLTQKNDAIFANDEDLLGNLE